LNGWWWLLEIEGVVVRGMLDCKSMVV
jgi:hypothetical protein